ncbi:MAG: 3'(2'),5'-bisphosphate nucleotidase CysQ [marine benthic group bacterium]|nr:3'(2'),5'-bisphosphate nucleotidase CysQ [Gemmatimonadota bacterium]
MNIPIPDSLPPEIARDLRTAGEAALRGGNSAMEHYGNETLAIAEKGLNDPVTAADHAANEAIHEVLAIRAPGESILSEESPPPAETTTDARSRLWIVDPLDGTKEFIAQNGEFAVMVGLSIGGRAAAGALYQPDPGVLYLGFSDGGAWEIKVDLASGDPEFGEPVTLELGPEPAEPVRFIRSRSHPDPLLAKLEERLPEADTVLCGSVGVKCARIATDVADVYVHPVAFLKEWDTCAPEAVLRGAGGRVTDCGGEPLTYGKPDPRQPRGIFAARDHTWGALRPMVREIATPILRTAG